MSGGGKQTIQQNADPWGPTRGPLTDMMSQGTSLYNQGGFQPDVFGGDRVAGFGDTSNLGMNMMLDQAGQPGATPMASQTLTNMMDPNYQSSQLEAVKSNALDSAIPAASSVFSGSGMLNSSQAMDTVGRAAMDAVAPYEYGAFENAQGRAMSAAGMAPQIDRAGYLPSVMTQGVGQQQDAMRQAMIDAEMQQFYEGANPELQNLQGYSQFLLPISGQGGSSTQTQPGPSTLAQIGGAGMTGLGAYGAFAANPATAPFAIPGGIAAGLLGLF